MIKILRYSDGENNLYLILNENDDTKSISKMLEKIDKKNNWSIGVFGSKKKAKFFIDHLKKAKSMFDIVDAIKLNQDKPINTKINKDVPIRENGQNANIKPYSNLTKKALEEYGFKNIESEKYTLHKMLTPDIMFYINIDFSKNIVNIDVLDDFFLKPYDYQTLLSQPNVLKTAYIVHEKIQEIMKNLLDNKIIEGYNLNDYI